MRSPLPACLPGHRLALVAMTASALVLSATPALAAGHTSGPIPDDLQFTYTLDQPLIGDMSGDTSLAMSGSCTQSAGDSFSLDLNGPPDMTGGFAQALMTAMQTPGNDVTCTLVSTATSTGDTLSGTVSAPGATPSATPSATGDFSLVCDSGRTLSSWFHALVDNGGTPALAPDPYGVNGSGYVSCAWTITLDDDQKSQLSGSLEAQGSFSEDSTAVDWSYCAPLGLPLPPPALAQAKCVQFDLDVHAYLTGATGAYAGRTGEGAMTQAVYVPMIIPIDVGSAPPTPECPPEVPDCGSGFTRAVLTPKVLGDLLSLTTTKGKAAAPRFVSPARTAAKGTTRKLAGVTSVRLATAPGAICTVTALAGKASSTLVKGARAPGGVLDTKVTGAKLRNALGAAHGSTAMIAATCSVKTGKRIAVLPEATITVKFA